MDKKRGRNISLTLSHAWSQDELTLRERWKVLAEYDVWVALTYDEPWIEAHPHVPILPKLLGLTPRRFKEIVETTPGLFGFRKGVSWKAVFNKNLDINTWGPGEDVTVKQGAAGEKSNLIWANFHENRSKLPIAYLESHRPLVRCLAISRRCGAIGSLEKSGESSAGLEGPATPEQRPSEEQGSPDEKVGSASKKPKVLGAEVPEAWGSYARKSLGAWWKSRRRARVHPLPSVLTHEQQLVTSIA